MARLASSLLLIAAALPLAFATNCAKNEFMWEEKSCCLTKGGQSNPPSPPKGISCPTNGWQWHTEQNCCVPTQPQTPSSPPPKCESDCSWDKDNYKCTPNKPSTPAKTTPAPPSKPTVPSTPSGSSSCESGHFWFDKIGCCPNGGPKTPPASPPGDTSCPPIGWYWHEGSQHCAPNNPLPPNSPPPQCKSGCGWNPDELKCHPQSPTSPVTPPPKPSGYHKRQMKSRAVTLCPVGFDACPIAGLMSSSGDYECVDITAELTSCGGCASTGAGQDCTAIEGVWNVACNVGKCQIGSCAQGYKLSFDRKTCIKL
ncbi:hypothetical protein BC835DRAFT_1308295 [Cytidiella melzeri]|nr:hypothetical protein BC835DRAFT_1308295 [Cytidiella melzeri]